ncbi:hypothetical protein LBMAG57_34590 [Verrucomicrobiota bacterium]|nr:hypothetical protein LBMAG57_34590 [Verrucomicrobiota bacterium]
MSELPGAWTEVLFDEINSFRSQTIDPSDYPNEVFELYSVPTFPTRKPELLKGSAIGSTKQVVTPGDVLVCKINPRINRVWKVMSKTDKRQIASSEWIVMRAKGMEPEFLRNFFSSQAFRETLCEDLTGVGGSLTRAQPKRVSKFKLPIAPLAEQKRIADKLEAVLGRVDACRARLDRVPGLLKRFRQSVLAAATSGQLSNEWRSLHKTSDRSQEIDIGEDTIEVPASWQKATLTDVIDSTRPLCYGVVQPGEEISGGSLLIRVQDMLGGRINTEGLRTISKDVDAEYKRSRVKIGDLLISVVGTIGRTSIVPSNLEANIARAVARIACRDGIDSRWVNYWLCCDTLQWWLASSSKEVARKTLNLSDLENAPVAIPSFPEQQEIVRRVEALFAFADRIEARLTEARAQVERLTPATLAKAFRGELVPQDPNDEPASAILERLSQNQKSK